MGQATCACWGPSDGQDVASDLEGEDTAGRLLAEKVKEHQALAAEGGVPASPGAPARAGVRRAEPGAEAAGGSVARGGAG